MLMGNAKEDGILSTHILKNKLGDKNLKNYLKYISQ